MNMNDYREHALYLIKFNGNCGKSGVNCVDCFRETILNRPDYCDMEIALNDAKFFLKKYNKINKLKALIEEK